MNQLTGGLTAQAGTDGGTAFFGGAATPVLLNLADGSAYIASGSPPADAVTKGAGSGPRSTVAPDASATAAPPGASLLGINVSEPDSSGKRSLSASVADESGKVLGSGQVSLPTDGWWVIGLGPKDATVPPVDPPVDPVPVDPIPVDPIPVPPVDPVPPTNPGPVAATPEPSTLALLGIGGAVGLWRNRRRK